ncbi:MAG: hypothetical protein SVM79_00120 [Chloroflexota bacterium]|nr:hypothetical protein [Chloroflexota bacterium]
MEDNEKFYDEVIAPKLMEIGSICKEKGIPFLAVTEYAPGEIGETRMQHPDECLKMVMIRHCTKTAPNIDGYIIGLARYANEKGIDTSGSIVMKQLTSGLSGR